MASAVTENPTLLSLQKNENDDNDNDEYAPQVSDAASSRTKRSFHRTASGRSYHMMDVRSQSARITPKHDLLANFVDPSRTHNLGLSNDLTSHSICQANGNVVQVPHESATRRLPTEILYNEEGLRLFDEITRMPSQEYYLTKCEEDIFQHEMDRLIPFVPDGCAIVELGCGSMAKTAIFLDALRQAGKKNICFYAIDIEKTYLESSLEELIEFEQATCPKPEDMYEYYGILGSYDQALETDVLKNLGRPKVFMWLGSSIGNWTRRDAQEFLRSFSDSAMNPFDLFFIGMDSRQNDPLTVAKAYNDRHGITREFGLNGLRHLNELLNYPLFDRDNFEYFAGYNEDEGRHEAYFQVLKDQTLKIPAELVASHTPTTVELKQGELINYEFSYKYSVSDIHELCDCTKFHLSELLYDSSGRYSFAVLSKAAFAPVPRSLMGKGYSPKLNEFEEVWKLWHTLTSSSIIQDPLLKPIDLRHPLLFYVGHIPAFQDIYQSRHFNEPLTEPSYFATIFERGINPVVEDPTQCHAHSQVPDEWPSIDAVREYDTKANNRVRDVYKKMNAVPDTMVQVGKQRLGRQLSIVLEHTVMHAETYIYMLVQLKRELLPKSYMPAYLRSESHESKPIPSACWVAIQPDKVSRGIPNRESEDDKKQSTVEMEYGWDNEVPAREYEVKHAFRAQSRPVTCGEYLSFLKTLKVESDCKALVPASWVEQENGDYAMLTLFGPIEVEKCLNCPVTLSYKLAEKYQEHLRVQLDDNSIRMPTEEEWVVMQSQLGEADECHPDFDFMNWMPAPLKPHHTVGSVWEWTNTVFDSYPGFEPSEMYPGYSADFFDGLHNVVRGAAWCTHGRVANRLRNFYQRSYPYAFVGVRFVRDA